jgi:hypothetical protein
MASKLLIKYATRSRPDRMFAIIDSVFNNADNPKDICLLLSLDHNDTLIYNKPVLSRLEPYLKKYNIKAFFGKRSSKIQAFNRDIEQIEGWKYLLHLTDFTEISSKGFDTRILNNMGRYTSNYSASFESLNSNGHHTNRIHLISKSCYESFGFIYNPKLKANFEEEELEHRVAKNMLRIEDIKIHRYVHPKWLYLNYDKLLVENIKHWKEDLETLEELIK